MRVHGPWTLGEPLGSGATATVWSARDGKGREAAVKLFRHRGGAVARRLLAAEVTALGRITHPLAPRLLWAGDDACATELVDGRPFDEVIARPAPIERVLPLLLDLLDVLAHVHSLGIVHRDLKPANLLVERVDGLGRRAPFERLRVVDFGLSSVRADDAFRRRELAGTLAYMAPEQRAGLPIDGRADLYAVGMIAAEAVGSRPEPIARMLAEAAGDRPATAEQALELLCTHIGVSDQRVARPRRGVPRDEALRWALGTARVPESLSLHAPATGLSRFLNAELGGRRLRYDLGRWTYAAAVSSGDELLREGRVDEAIRAFRREGAVYRASEILRRQQSYDDALSLFDTGGSAGVSKAEVCLARAHVLLARRQLEPALAEFRALPRRTPKALRADAVCGEGAALAALGRVAEAAVRYKVSVRLARDARRPAIESKSLANLGGLAVKRGAYAEAAQCYRDAIACARAGGDPGAAATALLNLGVVFEADLRLDEAADAYADGIDTSQRMGNRTAVTTGLLNLANVNARRLEIKRARDQYGQALRLAVEIADPVREALVLINIANLETLLGRFEAARRQASRAIQCLHATADRGLLAHAYRNRGEATLRAAESGESSAHAAAQEDLMRAEQLARATNNTALLNEIELDLAHVECGRGLLRHAALRATRALDESRRCGFRDHEIRAHGVLAAIYNRGGLSELALVEAQQVEGLASAAGIALHRIDALRQAGIALNALGRRPEASAVREAIENAEAFLADGEGHDG